MIRTINFEDHSVEVDTSAGWLYVYRKQFGNDVLQDVFPIILGLLESIAQSEGEGESLGASKIIDMALKLVSFELTTLFNIFWAMAANANKNIKPPMTFFNQFETVPLDIIAPEIFTMVIESSVSSKNAEGLLETIRTKKQI